MYLSKEQLERYQGCVRKTVEWAHSRYDKILAEPDLQGHYKAPAFWAAWSFVLIPPTETEADAS